MAKQEESSRRPRKNSTEGKPFSESRPERRNDDSRPRRENDRSFDKPRGERNFDKPERRNDEFRPRRENDRSFDKPRGERNGNKPERRSDESRPRRETDRPFDKPRGERSFDKPRGERSFDKPERRNDEFRPRRDNDRSFDKPRGERKEGESRFEKGSDRPGKRSFDKPTFPKGERPERSGSDKKELPSRYGKRADHDPTRRSGRRGHSNENETVKATPNYNIDKYKENAPEKIKKKIERNEKSSDTTRLNRYIALSGVCSRRDADVLIEAGEISVNGKVVKELGYQVKPGEVVRYGRRVLNPEKMVYVLLNKPKDYITTVEDDMDRRTVMELVKTAAEQRIYPVGRLDRNTTGLLLLTNDGEMAEKLTHPSHQIEKIYQVEIDKPITTEDFEAIRKGVELEDGLIKPDEVSIITPDAQVIGIRIHSGRNRIVRRIFEKFGYDVTKLDRTSFAGLNKKELPRGQWRYLTEKEVIRLKYLV
ncbi:pseudouridine synthase [Siphonobacter sp. BAB-5405]|uniref:pseudouridine synthase n=1 Tax=Siphonobacter sp. BAB-5405 TaxID=1864825 RepID=UPI001E39DD57|nr:pseudouridine synthase [Siphonobacter sp. BAB-5405]